MNTLKIGGGVIVNVFKVGNGIVVQGISCNHYAIIDSIIDSGTICIREEKNGLSWYVSPEWVKVAITLCA